MPLGAVCIDHIKIEPVFPEILAAVGGAGGGHFSFCWFFCWFFLKKQRFYIGGFESDNLIETKAPRYIHLGAFFIGKTRFHTAGRGRGRH